MAKPSPKILSSLLCCSLVSIMFLAVIHQELHNFFCHISMWEYSVNVRSQLLLSLLSHTWIYWEPGKKPCQVPAEIHSPMASVFPMEILKPVWKGFARFIIIGLEFKICSLRLFYLCSFRAWMTSEVQVAVYFILMRCICVLSRTYLAVSLSNYWFWKTFSVWGNWFMAV